MEWTILNGKKTDLASKKCGIARSLNVIGDWWTLLIVRDAFNGRRRFNDFQKNLGMAKNILSSRLKKLVEEGVFSVVEDNVSGSSHNYVLTPKGEQLYLVLVALWQWGENNCQEAGDLDHEMVDAKTARVLPQLKLLAHDGRELGPREFKMKAI
jgi:DNA-binding HxlR family transcriptional regulator